LIEGSIRVRKPRDRNAGGTRAPRIEQAPRLFGPVGLEVGFQQREFDHVVLRAAAANALVFGGERGKYFYCREKSPRSNAANPRESVGR